MLDEEEKEQVETQLANDAADGEAASSQPSKAGGIRQWCADNKKPFAAIIMLSVLLVASIAAGCIVYTAEHNALASVNEECAGQCEDRFFAEIKQGIGRQVVFGGEGARFI